MIRYRPATVPYLDSIIALPRHGRRRREVAALGSGLDRVAEVLEERRVCGAAGGLELLEDAADRLPDARAGALQLFLRRPARGTLLDGAFLGAALEELPLFSIEPLQPLRPVVEVPLRVAVAPVRGPERLVDAL